MSEDFYELAASSCTIDQQELELTQRFLEALNNGCVVTKRTKRRDAVLRRLVYAIAHVGAIPKFPTQK